MMLKRWTKIEDCPHGKSFFAVLKLGWMIKISKVYVHVDNNFLMWRCLKYDKNKEHIHKWKCIFYLTPNKE